MGSNFEWKHQSRALFIDLSKDSDSLDHSSMLAKLNTYGFDNNSLSFVQIDLTNIFQRCKTDNDLSSWDVMTNGVPQNSNFGPLLVNVFIIDTFLFVESSNNCN